MTETAQSFPRPAPQATPAQIDTARLEWRDLFWLVPTTLRGTWELIRARVAFARLTARRIVERNRASAQAAEFEIAPDARLLSRIAYVLPRISRRLPWRSDCLIQATAGQNWLAAKGLASELRIGVNTGGDIGKAPGETGDFGAHAWLVCDEIIVTGGDIDRYEELLSGAEAGSDDRPPH